MSRDLDHAHLVCSL